MNLDAPAQMLGIKRKAQMRLSYAARVVVIHLHESMQLR